MFRKLSEKLVNMALQRKIIQSDDVEECVYGINTFLTIALNIITIFIVGLLTDMLIEIAIYIIVFKALRKYVGGSHSSTHLRCYFSSFVTYTLSILIVKYYMPPKYFAIAITMLSAIIMFIFAPVDAINKPLDDLERSVFRKRAYIRILICLLLFMLLCFTQFIPNSQRYSIAVMISMLTVAIFTITGKRQLVSFQQTKNKEVSA